MNTKLKFVVEEGGELPSQPKKGDVGVDLKSKEHITISPGTTMVIDTGLLLAEVPDGYFPKIEGRSGLAAKGIFPVGGIVDPAYRGKVGVILFNSTDLPYSISAGDRIAQFVLYRTLNWVEPQFQIEQVRQAEETSRGAKGFGSSGN